MFKEVPGTEKHSFPVYMSTDISVVLYLYIRRETNWVKRGWGGRVLGDWWSKSGNSMAPFSSSTGLGWGVRGRKHPSCKNMGEPRKRWPQKPFGNHGRSFLTVHDERTWEVTGLKGDGPTWARRSHTTFPLSGRRGSFFSYCLLL